jgi:hypothetical protein
MRGGNLIPHFTRAEVHAEIAARKAAAAHAATADERAESKKKSDAHIKALLTAPKRKHNYGSLKNLMKNGNNAF